MRVLEKVEVSVVYGGLMDAGAEGDGGGSGGTPVTSSGSTSFPNTCPPGYTGTTLGSTSTTNGGFSSSGTLGATGPVPTGSATLNGPTTSTTNTYTQVCLPNPPSTNTSSGTSSGSSSSGTPSTSCPADKSEDETTATP